MPKVECCGNCMFFAEHKGETCVRFPPPQQARVLEDDWCGEWVYAEPAAPEPKKEPIPDIRADLETRERQIAQAHAAKSAERGPPVVVTTKRERLASFGDLARRL